MKYFILLLLAIFPSLLFAAPSVNTKGPIGQIVTSYSSTNVGTSTAVQVLASVPSNGATMLDVFDSSGQTLQLSYTINSINTVIAVVYPGGNGQVQVSIPAGAALYLKSLTSTANSGYSIINLFY